MIYLKNTIRMENEIWKPVSNYQGIYEVSNFGRVKSLSREIIFKPALDRYGYYKIVLRHKGIKKNTKIHRLVAETFLPKQHDRNYVNHKNGIKTDNSLSNLEWVSPKENTKHSYLTGLRKGSLLGRFGKDHHMSKSINQLTKNNEIIKKWESLKQVERELGFDTSSLSKCAQGKLKTSYGFKWEYV